MLAIILASLVGSPAQAIAAKYTSSTYPTTVTGEGNFENEVFDTGVGTVRCKSHYSGTVSLPSISIAVSAKPSECRAWGFFFTAEVSMGSCYYLLKEPMGGADSFSAAVDIKCTNASSPISVWDGPCKFSVSEQSPSGTIAITNDTVQGDVKVQANLSGIKYTVTQDGIGCPFNGTGEKTGATFIQKGAVTIDSTNGATIDIG